MFPHLILDESLSSSTLSMYIPLKEPIRVTFDFPFDSALSWLLKPASGQSEAKGDLKLSKASLRFAAIAREKGGRCKCKGCSQNYGPLVVTHYIAAPNLYRFRGTKMGP